MARNMNKQHDEESVDNNDLDRLLYDLEQEDADDEIEDEDDDDVRSVDHIL